MLYRGEFVLRPELLTRLMHRLRTAALPLWGLDHRAEELEALSPVGAAKAARNLF